MKTKLIVIIGLVIMIMFLCGCNHSQRETGELTKYGKVMKIKEDVIFGGTFTDWRDELYFNDGTILWIENSCDLSSIELNRSGTFFFEKNYFTYDGVDYEFHEFRYVRWDSEY